MLDEFGEHCGVGDVGAGFGAGRLRRLCNAVGWCLCWLFRCVSSVRRSGSVVDFRALEYDIIAVYHSVGSTPGISG